ncbi:sequence-specific DNA binding transcription factors [Striga asiatica]|uniref:Sequence-specific DNA binding transcription factors n=1 Tax=Striga asiatica TaxID=4170 RepID=A0A5A7QSF7_STRAF|nr:sequence-specific DNA binding transcription factors [Striga asiatica]
MSSRPTPSPPHSTTTSSPSLAKPPAFSSREDCWSKEASRTLIHACVKHWQQVARAVNASSLNLRRSDVQCKNRIDTTKKNTRSRSLRSSNPEAATSPLGPTLKASTPSSAAPSPVAPISTLTPESFAGEFYRLRNLASTTS